MKEASITKNKLIFDGTTKENSIFFRQKKFELPLDDIKVIGVKFGMFLDDEYAIIIIVSNTNKKYFLYSNYIEIEAIKELNIRFGIDLFYAVSEYFEHEVDQFRSKILYPTEKAGEPIFKEKNLITGLYLMFGKLFLQLHYADGLLTKEVKML